MWKGYVLAGLIKRG